MGKWHPWLLTSVFKWLRSLVKKDIGLVIELPSNNDISRLSLSFKLAYVGAIVVFPNTEGKIKSLLVTL